MRASDALGRYGEDLAAQHLTAVGMRVVARNWRCSDGELDLIALDGGDIVFIEVKTRSSISRGEPAEAVGATKARRLRRLACRWLREHPAGRRGLRFDVVSIVRRPGCEPVLEHLRGAF